MSVLRYRFIKKGSSVKSVQTAVSAEGPIACFTLLADERKEKSDDRQYSDVDFSCQLPWRA